MRTVLTTGMTVLLLLSAANLSAQEVRDNASVAFPVLSVGVGARAVAMGESFVSVADDGTAAYWNPAGLVQLDQQQASFTHHSYIQGSMAESLFYSRPVGSGSGLGINLTYIDYGPFENRDASGNLLGTYHPRDQALGASFGHSLGRKFSLGLRSTWLRQTILDSKHSALAWDLGGLVRANSRFAAGLNLKSLGVNSAGGKLPTEVKAGVSYRIPVGDGSTLTYTGGAAFLPDSVSHANVGFEYSLRGNFFGRAGSVIDFGRNPQDWKKGLSLGAGARLDSVQLDYAFSFGGDLGDSHRLSLTGYWGSRRTERGSGTGTLESGKGGGKESAQMPVTLTFELPGKACSGPGDCFDKALELEKKGQLQESLRYYLKAVEYDARLEAAWLRLGRLYYALGRESFEKALRANPNNQALRQWLQLQP